MAVGLLEGPIYPGIPLIESNDRDLQARSAEFLHFISLHPVPYLYSGIQPQLVLL